MRLPRFLELPRWPLLALVALGACSSGPEPARIDPERQLALYTETAYFHFRNDDYARAEAQALKALELEPEHLKMRMMVAWVRQKRDTRDALLSASAIFEQVLDELAQETDEQVVAENRYSALLGLAAVEERLGVLADESARALESNSAGDSANAPALAELARSSLAKARQHYEAILGERPDDRSALNGLQRVLALQGDYAGSLAYSQQLLRGSEADLAFYRRQLERQDIGAVEEQQFQRSLRAATELQVATHLFASSALSSLGRDAEALEHIDAVVALQPSLPEAYSRRAQAREKLGLYEGAMHDIDLYLRHSPHEFDHPDVRAAYDLRTRCERAFESTRASGSGQ